MSAKPLASGSLVKWLVHDLGVVTIIYLVLGYLGINFATGSGYASPIFPAAGFAVACMLWSNGRAWLGIWLGAFMLNLGISCLKGHFDWISGVAAGGVACGALAQAFVARWLVLRSIGNGWQTLETERDIFYLMALAGPVAGLTSATVGITTLFAMGIISFPEFFYAWLNWWSGDVLGILALLPICLTLYYRHEMPWSGRLTTLLIPMILVLTVVGAAFYAVTQWERSEQKLGIQLHGEQLANLLKQRFIAHQEVVAALHRLIEVTPEMSLQQFEYFTRISLEKNPDISALSFNPFVSSAQRQAFEREMATKTGQADFKIKQKNPQNQLVPAFDRPFYVAVGYIAPKAGNEAAIGYDINSEPIRHDAIQRAMLSGNPAITAPINLVQENRQRIGVLLLNKAEFGVNGQHLSTDAGMPMGFAVAVIKVDEMVEIATRANMIDGLVFQVDDRLVASENSAIYRSEALPVNRDEYFTWQAALKVADRVWSLKITPTREYLLQASHWASLLVGSGGLALAALLQMLLLITTGRASIFQSKVNQQTAELQAKTDVLEDRNEQLTALFALSPDGFITFDKSYRVKYVSPAFTDLIGLAEERVIGLDETEFSNMLAKLCISSARFCGIETLRTMLATDDQNSAQQRELIELSSPRNLVLQVGLRLSPADAGTVSQILYFRDVTHESEIDRMKSEFLSTAAHELRTPMASIFGFAELLLMQEFDEGSRQELLSVIYKQSELMSNIINELLDLARIEARRGKDFVYATVCIDELLTEVVSSYKPPDGRAAPLIRRPEQVICIYVDRSKTLQALTNLLSNAYKYSPDGGDVSITILTVMHGEQPGCAIQVRDDGIGMTTEQLARATERFYRADESGQVQGTGLGLSIVKEIVELQGGDMVIDSEFQLGTTVTLWFPLAA